MDDKLLALFQTLESGVDYKEKEQILKILKNPPTGKTVVDMVGIPDLEKKIVELAELNEGYRSRGWKDIEGNGSYQVKEFRENYLRLHKEIVDYFTRVSYGDFHTEALEHYDSIQNRILLGEELTEKRKEIQAKWDFYHEVAAMPHQIKLLPEFSLQGAIDYGKPLVINKIGESRKVTEKIMKEFLSESKDKDKEYLHTKFFLAELFKEQQPKRIEELTNEVDNFERSFQKVSDNERGELSNFKKNLDPKYCSKNYLLVYRDFCIDGFKNLEK